jgi:FixJ family two-component response regulator
LSPVRVAVVEDDAPVRRAVARLLVSAGFAVTTYASAEDFLTHLDDDLPDCLLLDLHLPRMGGMQLHQCLRSLGHVPAVIFITADDELARSPAIRRSGIPCLVKPCDDELLIAAIREKAPHAPVS